MSSDKPKSKSQAFREIVSQCMSQGMSHHEAVAHANSMTTAMPDDHPLDNTVIVDRESQIESVKNLN